MRGRHSGIACGRRARFARLSSGGVLLSRGCDSNTETVEIEDCERACVALQTARQAMIAAERNRPKRTAGSVRRRRGSDSLADYRR